MSDIEILAWDNLPKVKWHSLLLGNGASISLYEKFDYSSLFDVANTRGLLPAAAPLFAKLGTKNFEHALLACWYANQVNSALASPSPCITAVYEEVRAALIQVVREVCVPPSVISSRGTRRDALRFPAPLTTAIADCYAARSGELFRRWSMASSSPSRAGKPSGASRLP